MKSCEYVPTVCILHPKEKLKNGLCLECIRLTDEISKEILDKRISRRNKAIFLYFAQRLCIDPKTRNVVILALAGIVHNEGCCHECEIPLTNGFCEFHTKHYMTADFSRIIARDSLENEIERILEACIPEHLKIKFLEKAEWHYKKLQTLREEVDEGSQNGNGMHHLQCQERPGMQVRRGAVFFRGI